MIFVISDIHGNYDALKVFFDKIRICKNDLVIALGDYVGYYYEPNKCIDLLKKNKVICLKGNHDENFLKSVNKKEKLLYFSKKYGNAYKVAKKTITKDNINFLKNLKKNKSIKIRDIKIKFSHGSPWKIDQYIYPNTNKEILFKFNKFKYNIFFVGHTHRKLYLKINKKKIYNPGSIGQPRDKKKGLHWIEFNEKTCKVKFKSIKYDTSLLKKKIKINDAEKYSQLSKYL